MNFILYSDIGETEINKGLGLPEYSYFFVLKAFRLALEELGTVKIVQHPETEVDLLFDECQQRCEECIFLSFSPPNKTLVDLKCPTISVFAWEYSNIPNAQWDDNLRNDWRTVFAQHGRTITLSGYTVRTVQEAMGQDFPVIAVPTPLWEYFSGARQRLGPAVAQSKSSISLRGTVLDSRDLKLSVNYLITPAPVPIPPVEQQLSEVVSPPVEQPQKNIRYRLAVTKRHLLNWYREAVRDLLPLWFAKVLAASAHKAYSIIRAVKGGNKKPAIEPIAEPVAVKEEIPPEPEAIVNLSGVVYTSVFSPKDGRKNWSDLVTAFCWTFRDVDDVTLVLKMNARDLSTYQHTLMSLLSQLSPFKCRVITLHAFLDDASYEQLIGATTFYVNTSKCEGLCLPLLEFMSCGKPVIAPDHTAMEDYIDNSVAFVLKSSPEQNVWSHDPREILGTLRYRLDWTSICKAYQESYAMAKNEPEHYEKMSDRVLERMQSYASLPVVKEKLQRFFEQTSEFRPL